MYGRSPKKQKAKKGSHTDPSTSTQRALASIKNDGTKDAPIALISDAEDELGTPRNKPVPSIGSVGLLGHTLVKGKRHLTVMEGGKKKKMIDVETFHPDLQESFETLKRAIANGAFFRWCAVRISLIYDALRRGLGAEGKVPAVYQALAQLYRRASHPTRPV